MLSSLLRSALVLAAVCCLTSAESIITCGDKIQRLSCDQGVVSVLTVAYGRTNRQTCSEGKHSGELADTDCVQYGALETLANRCNGKKVCEVDQRIFGADPCRGTHKYIQTTYTCLPAHHEVACEDSEVELKCDSGQKIALIGAFYGRSDRTTCIYGVPDRSVNNIDCFARTANRVVTESVSGSLFWGRQVLGTGLYLSITPLRRAAGLHYQHQHLEMHAPPLQLST
ncbi:unnamed protein product [Boreogadus saida]